MNNIIIEIKKKPIPSSVMEKLYTRTTKELFSSSLTLRQIKKEKRSKN